MHNCYLEYHAKVIGDFILLLISTNCQLVSECFALFFFFFFFTDETLALLESFSYLIVMFCCRGSECEGKVRNPLLKKKKMAVQKFSAASYKPIKLECFKTVLYKIYIVFLIFIKHMHVHRLAHTHIHTCLCLCGMFMYLYICTHVSVCVCVCVCVYLCVG